MDVTLFECWDVAPSKYSCTAVGRVYLAFIELIGVKLLAFFFHEMCLRSERSSVVG